jgi:hypothetical protein
VAAFVASPNAERLRILEAPGVGDNALQALAASPHLGRLTVVRFGGCTGPARLTPATEAGALALARSTGLPNLVVLNRFWPKGAVAGLRALVECGRLAYAGSGPCDADPVLTAARRQAGVLPHALTSTQGLLPMFPWSSGARA